MSSKKKTALTIERLAIAITFFYRPDRLGYLSTACQHHPTLSEETKTFVVTNTRSADELSNIRQACDLSNLEIVTPSHLGHPFLLTWIHRHIFQNLLEQDAGFTHYMYAEDDILITRDNINYWLEASELLASTRFLPAFFRYEINSDRSIVSTDITRSLRVGDLYKLRTSHGTMIQFPNPYQGMYLLDTEGLRELLYTAAGSPDYGCWGIREKAAQGLCFWNVPAGSTSRYLVATDGEHLLNEVRIDPRALIHHMPNNYAEDATSPFGKILLSQLLLPGWSITGYTRNVVRRLLR